MAEASGPRSHLALSIASGFVLVCDLALVATIIVLDRVSHVEPPKDGGVDTSAPIGWVGTLGAVFIFGCFGILIKSPAVREAKVDPMIFQCYYSIGVCLISSLIWLIAGSTDGFVFSWLGIVFAALWIGSQVFAINAIQLVGYAVGPAVWAGLTIVVSFVWGVAAFSNPVKSIPGSVAALVVLVLGVCLAAASSVVPSRLRGAREVDLLRPEEGTPLETPLGTELSLAEAGAGSGGDEDSGSPAASKFISGILCAIAVGLMNGSLMVPMTIFQNGSEFLRVSKYGGEGIAAIAFLPSLVISVAVVQPVFFVAYFSQSLVKKKLPEFHMDVALIPGLLTGAFWGMGNFSAMFASTYLGQSVGYPLTQMCIIVNGLWGVLFYKEITGPLPVGLFSIACMVIVLGAYLDGTQA